MKFYLLSPQCPPNPHLFPMWVDAWRNQGVEIVGRIEDADVVCLDLHVRQFDYRQEDIDWISQNNPKIAVWDEYDRGGMSKDAFPYPLTKQQIQVLDSRGDKAYFCRLLNKKTYQEYRLPLYPYEKPYFEDFGLLTPEDLFNRPYDLTFIANTAPQRETLAKALRVDARLKCNILLGAQKMPFNEWVNEHRKAKFFVSCSGGGYSNERPQNLLSVAAHLREKTDQLLLNPYINTLHCIEVSTQPTKHDLDTIVEVCNNKDVLYSIYKNGYDFIKTHYSKEYIATDILNKIKTNLCTTTV